MPEYLQTHGGGYQYMRLWGWDPTQALSQATTLMPQCPISHSMGLREHRWP